MQLWVLFSWACVAFPAGCLCHFFYGAVHDVVVMLDILGL